MTKPTQSWLADAPVEVSPCAAMTELDRWCRARTGRSIVYSIDSGFSDRVEYCVMVDDGNTCVSNKPAPTASGAWSIAVAAVREWERVQ